MTKFYMAKQTDTKPIECSAATLKPADWSVTEPLAPECDLLCQAAEDLLTAQ